MNSDKRPFEVLVKDLGIVAFKELLDLFKNTFPQKMKRISELISAKNFEPIYFETHQMVSSAANMGANTVSDLIREFETELKNNTKQAEQILDKIRNEFATYVAEADTYISSGNYQTRDLEGI